MINWHTIWIKLFSYEGWGNVKFGGVMANALKTAVVKVMNFKQCQFYNNKRPLIDSQICTYAEGQDACQVILSMIIKLLLLIYCYLRCF